MNPHVPLLSGKPVEEFDSAEYKEYIISLYHKPEPKKGVSKAKPFSFRVNQKGTLIITTVTRDPKYLTAAEMEMIGAETGKKQSEIFIKMKEKGWLLLTHEQYQKLMKGKKDEKHIN